MDFASPWQPTAKVPKETHTQWLRSDWHPQGGDFYVTVGHRWQVTEHSQHIEEAAADDAENANNFANWP